jgi:hypothetical protein
MSVNILTHYRSTRFKIFGRGYRLAGAFEPVLYLGIGAASLLIMASIVMDLARAIWS